MINNQYSIKYSENQANPLTYTIEFTIINYKVFVIIKHNDKSTLLGNVERINDSFTFHYIDNDIVNNYKKNDALINEIKNWIENYFNMRDLYFPRVYLNTARALADYNLWIKLDKMIKDENASKNIELIQYSMSSLISGTAIFSYAAIESFVNESLIKVVGVDEFQSIDSEVNTKSLREKLKKLCDVLILNYKIQNNKIWNDFLILDDVRHSFIHYKQDNIFNILNKYGNKVNPSFLLNTGIDVIKFFYAELNLPLNDYLILNRYQYV